MAAGMALAAGDPAIKPLNPAWDERWMSAVASADFDTLASPGEESIASQAGLSAHESKTWVIARAAMPVGVSSNEAMRYYRAIPEYIAGFGILLLTRQQA
ncbi:MAG: hypothetical protein R3E68_16900 [Burkholderiaceae bacterium]